MNTTIKFNALKNKPREEQVKLLAGAIAFEFAKPVNILEAIGAHALNAQKTAKLLNQPSANSPVFDRIKNYFAVKYATTSDNPILNDIANQLEQFYHTNMPDLDMGFSLLFDMVDLRGSNHDHFDIIDTNAGVSWEQRKPGEMIKIRRSITEAKATVSYLEFADGIGLLDAWLDFQQFWTIDEAIAEFRAKYYDKMAETHYGLFTALGAGVNQAFATDDATTFNNAAAAILRAVRTKGYAAGQNAQFYILTSPERLGRIQKMLTAIQGSPMVDYGTMGQPIAFSVRGVIATTHVTAADTGYYLVLPGRKIKRGAWKDLTTESARNIYVTATDIVGTGRYNAAIGDSDQLKRVLFA